MIKIVLHFSPQGRDEEVIATRKTSGHERRNINHRSMDNISNNNNNSNSNKNVEECEALSLFFSFFLFDCSGGKMYTEWLFLGLLFSHVSVGLFDIIKSHQSFVLVPICLVKMSLSVGSSWFAVQAGAPEDHYDIERGGECVTSKPYPAFPCLCYRDII